MMSSTEGSWLSILDYAQFSGRSISTIRRYIKSGRLKTKQEGGKFFIFVAGTFQKSDDELSQKLFARLEEVEAENKKLKAELNEMKMLVRLYEDKKTESGLPRLPLS